MIKTLIRRSEARAAGRCCGIPVERLHFMDLPFYETGRVKKKPLGEADIRMTVDLLRKIAAAPDLRGRRPLRSARHASHLPGRGAPRLPASVERDDWYRDCEVWLYRGAWQEWAPHQIEMAVPLSPSELDRKRAAIFKHESQKDRALFPGPDMREFWQRAEQRNRETARLYDRLGLAEYEAIEGFVRWDARRMDLL